MKTSSSLLGTLASGPMALQNKFICLWNQPISVARTDLGEIDESLATMRAHLEAKAYVNALIAGFAATPSLVAAGLPLGHRSSGRESISRWTTFLRLWQKAAAWYGQVTNGGSLDANLDLKALLTLDNGAHRDVSAAIASCYYTLAHQGRGGDVIQALRLARDSIQEALATGDSPCTDLSGANSVAGSIYLAMGQAADAVRHFGASVRLDESLGNTDASIGRHLIGLGSAEATTTAPANGVTKMLEGLQICEAAQHPGFSVSGYLSLATHYSGIGEIDAAANAINGALKWLGDPKYTSALRHQRRLVMRQARRLNLVDPVVRTLTGNARDGALDEYLGQLSSSLTQGSFYASCSLAAAATERLVACLLTNAKLPPQNPHAMLMERIRHLRGQGICDDDLLDKIDILRRLVRNPASHADIEALSEQLTIEDLMNIYRWMVATVAAHDV